MYINAAEEVSGYRLLGYDLDIGASGYGGAPDPGADQRDQRGISSHPIAADGISVSGQGCRPKISGGVWAACHGIVDYPTWYKIQEIYGL